MALELQQLRQVIALAEHGSFVRAAAALHISQPALSRSIQSVERRFGSELFLRSKTGIVPTDVGRVYIERARDLLRIADALDREAVHLGTLQTGRVAVGAGPYPAEAVLARAAASFGEQYPGVHLRVSARNWDELLRLLRARELDFFIAETSTMQREADLVIAPLSSALKAYFIARKGHPLASRRRVTTADVLEWPFAAPGRIPPRVLDPLLATHRSVTQRTGIRRSFPSFECDALAPMKRIIASTNAITASILTCVSTELETGQFVLLGTEPWMQLQYGIVGLRGHPLSHPAEKFRAFVAQAEREAVAEERMLIERYAPEQPPRRQTRRRPA